MTLCENLSLGSFFFFFTSSSDVFYGMAGVMGLKEVTSQECFTADGDSGIGLACQICRGVTCTE